MQHLRGFFFPEADTARADAFLASGQYELVARDVALNLCRRFRRAVDVGAHVGLNSRALAARFAAVEAFEPQQQVFRCLQANVAPSGVRAHAAALSDSAAPGFIIKIVGRDSFAPRVTATRERGTIPCAVRTLDEYGWTDVDFLRIGLTDGVAGVLAGAERTLRRSLPTLWLAGGGELDAEVAAALERLGYRPVASLANSLVFNAIDVLEPAPPQDLIVRGGGLGDRLLSFGDGADALPVGSVAAAVDGRIRPAEVLAYRGDSGSHQMLSVGLSAGAPLSEAATLAIRGGETALSSVPSVELEAALGGARASFQDGAFRLSLPPAALAYFREAMIGLKRTDGEPAVARVDLLQAENLDAIAVRPPLALADANVLGLTVKLRGAAGLEHRLDLPAKIDPSQISAEMVTCYLNHGGGGNPVINAFASSLGARLAYAEDGARDGAAIIWGVLRGSKAVIDTVAARNGFFYYIDHAYFSRGHLNNYRVTRNGFEAGPVRACPTDRLAALDVQLKPWGKGGRAILVCPPTDYFIEAHGAQTWLEDTLATLRANTDREIIVRLKPQPGQTVVPLETAMAEAHAVVTHSSNVAVEAVIAGTPVFVAPNSAAAPMGLTDLARIEHPVRPDREAWLAHLSYSQFSFEEVKTGEAWQLLREFETRPFIERLEGRF